VSISYASFETCSEIPTPMNAAMVMVQPSPIALVKGRTNADAAAANRYRTTLRQLIREPPTIINGDDLGTSSLHCIQAAEVRYASMTPTKYSSKQEPTSTPCRSRTRKPAVARFHRHCHISTPQSVAEPTYPVCSNHPYAKHETGRTNPAPTMVERKRSSGRR
jgi:hypothetical protein